MELFISKILPIFLYPLGFACLLLFAALLIKPRTRWNRIGFLLALVVLFLAGNHWVANGLAYSLERRYLSLDTVPQTDVIVVLGGGTQTLEEPRRIVEVNGAGDRVIYSAWLYHQGAADHILVSGGRIPWRESNHVPTSTPAEEMTDLLIMLNVPENAIWQETLSTNTYENARNSARFLTDKGIENILLVTSAMHMPRSVRLYEAQGLKVVPAPTDYNVTVNDLDFKHSSWQVFLIRLLPSADNLSLTTRALKEYLGIVVYSIRGWD